MRTTIAFPGAAILAVTIAACATWQPFYQPPAATVTPDPTPSIAAMPTPTPSPPTPARHKDPAASRAAPTPALITDSTPGQRDAAAKSVEEVSATIGRIDRSRLNAADAESYDLAVNLFAGARKSLDEKQYEAAASLAHKSSILLGTIADH